MQFDTGCGVWDQSENCCTLNVSYIHHHNLTCVVTWNRWFTAEQIFLVLFRKIFIRLKLSLKTCIETNRQEHLTRNINKYTTIALCWGIISSWLHNRKRIPINGDMCLSGNKENELISLLAIVISELRFRGVFLGIYGRLIF